MKIFWKWVVNLLKCQKKDYINTIPLGEDLYIVHIYKFVPVQEELHKWRDALGKPKA